MPGTADPAGSPCPGRTAHYASDGSTRDVRGHPCVERGSATTTRRTKHGDGSSLTSWACVGSPTSSAFWTCGVCGSTESPSACRVCCPCETFQSRGCVSASVCACKYIIEGALAQPVHAPPPLFFKIARTSAQLVASAVSLVQTSEQQVWRRSEVQLAGVCTHQVPPGWSTASLVVEPSDRHSLQPTERG